MIPGMLATRGTEMVKGTTRPTGTATEPTTAATIGMATPIGAGITRAAITGATIMGATGGTTGIGTTTTASIIIATTAGTISRASDSTSACTTRRSRTTARASGWVMPGFQAPTTMRNTSSVTTGSLI